MTELINLKITTGNRPVSPFLGIRDIIISLATKQSYDFEEASIVVGNANIPKSSYCPYGSYGSAFGSCTPCVPPCIHCFGPSASQCYTKNFLAYFDGSKTTTCTNSECYGCWAAGNKCYLCIDSSYFLDQDYGCYPTCDATTSYKFDTSNPKRCIPKCPDGDFLAWDSSCKTSCDPPLNPTIDSNGYKLCEYPCAQSIHNFLYPDGTCRESCPFLQINENNHRLCRPCQTGYYMYSSGACLSSCHEMFNVINIEGSNLCQSPCKPGQFLYPDRSCRDICSSSFVEIIAGQPYVCNIPLTKQEVSQAKTIGIVQKTFGQILTSCCENY